MATLTRLRYLRADDSNYVVQESQCATTAKFYLLGDFSGVGAYRSHFGVS